MDSITVKNLSKKFKDVLAVDNISFNVKAGELFGFLGPNGAGKTTTINMLSTLIRPGSGDARVMGFDIKKQRDHVRKSIGVVFQEPALDSRLTGRENLEFHAMMYSMNKSDRNARIKEVLELVELTEKAGKKVETYSGGMKRRLEIARGLMHRPSVLFLDEPTIGLDSQTRRHIWDYIKKLNRETGITMMLTTHYMEEADYLCDRILIIDYGKIVALDTPSNLKNILGGDVVDLEINGIKGACTPLLPELEKLDWIRTIKEHECSLSLTMNSGETRIPQLVSIAGRLNIEISSINLHKPSLDDVFIHFTGKTIREHAN
jgi:ABC-2 type transport system ATP-binding protein